VLRYSFGNIDGKAYGLNANELSVYEAIGKCSRKDDARGWYASMQALADQLPFVISKPTVSRAVDKLLTLGLIERRGDKSLFLVQNETKLSQNETQSSQIETQSFQNETNPTPPYNPPINNNNEMENENTRTLVPAHEAATSDLRTIYFEIRKIFNDKHGLHKVGEGLAAEEAWKQASHAKRVKLLEAVKSGQWDKPRIDWLIADFPEPKPHILDGFEQEVMWRNGMVPMLVKYDGKFVAVTEQEMILFGLEFVRKILPLTDHY
jgi:hypothetical protein